MIGASHRSRKIINVEMFVDGETDGAFLASRIDEWNIPCGMPISLPKSVCDIEWIKCKRKTAVFTMPEWFAAEHRII